MNSIFIMTFELYIQNYIHNAIWRKLYTNFLPSIAESRMEFILIWLLRSFINNNKFSIAFIAYQNDNYSCV